MRSEQLLDLLAAPSACCDATGLILLCSSEFAEWMEGGELQRMGRRFLLRLPDGNLRELGSIGLSDGNFLVFVDEERSCVASVVRRVARDLGQLGRTLEAVVTPGMPREGAAEALAGCGELRRLKGQLDALFSTEQSPRGTVSLRGLLQEVLRSQERDWELLEGPSGVVLGSAEELFPVLATLLQRVPGKLRLRLQEGEQVRLSLQAEQEMGALPCLEAVRSVLEGLGGRLLVLENHLLLELPAWRSPEVRKTRSDATVLVVDDDDTVLAMIDVVLRRAGFRVLLARNGVEASAMLRQHAEIDALVADAMLPGRSGIEVAREARRQNLPVLMISGHDRQMLGITDLPLLQKPFGASILAEAVERMVGEV